MSRSPPAVRSTWRSVIHVSSSQMKPPRTIGRYASAVRTAIAARPSRRRRRAGSAVDIGPALHRAELPREADDEFAIGEHAGQRLGERLVEQHRALSALGMTNVRMHVMTAT